MPDTSILANVRGKRTEALLTAELERLKDEAVNISADLSERVRRWLEANPTGTWDDALAALAVNDLSLIEG